MAGWLAFLFQQGNDAWCFQSSSVCVCVSVCACVCFWVLCQHKENAGIHIKEDEREKGKGNEGIQKQNGRNDVVKLDAMKKQVQSETPTSDGGAI